MSSQNQITNALGNAYNALNNFGAKANQYRPDAIVLDALGEAFGMRKNIDINKLDDTKNDAGEYEPTLKQKFFGITPDEIKETRAQKIKDKFVDDVSEYGLKLGPEDDPRKLSSINRDLAKLKLQESKLQDAKISGKTINLEKGVILPGSELASRIEEAQAQRTIDQSTATKQAEHDFLYKVPSDGTAPAVGDPARGAARQGQRSNYQRQQDQILGAKIAETNATNKILYGEGADLSAGTKALDQKLALQQRAAEQDMDFHSKGQQYLRHDNDRKFAFTKERAGRSDFESDRSFADTIKARNQAIDMEVMRMENANEQMRMKYEYQQEADQQSMIGNLLGGLFSLGSLL